MNLLGDLILLSSLRRVLPLFASSCPLTLSQDLFPDIPYAPFNKADTLGKIADWTASSRQQQQRAFSL